MSFGFTRKASPLDLARLCFTLVITVLVLFIPRLQTFSIKSDKYAKFPNPVVILISFDGFRWDYFDRVKLKNFEFIMRQGVRAKSLKSTFITKTFPNHLTLVTGLYEESHGIIANRMFDPVYNETFTPKTNDSKWWNASVPIWIQNEWQNKQKWTEKSPSSKESRDDSKRKSAAIFWVGSNVKYNGLLPSFFFPKYNGSFSTKERFNLVVSLLKEKNPPNFIACYIAEPDQTGHKHGPDSLEIKATLLNLDMLFGQFLDEMRENGFLELVNLVIVSDHGMAAIKPQNQIVLNDIISPDWYTAVNIDVFVSIMPKPGFKSKIFEKLKSIQNLTVYLKDDIPEGLHYKNNLRVPQILALADEGFVVTQSKENIAHTIGNHGYSNEYKSMHGIFIAAGPAFKKDYIGETFSNIHVYELLCKVLDMKPYPNNGSILAIENFLVKPLHSKGNFLRPLTLKILLISLASLLMFVVLIGICIQCCKTGIGRKGYIGASRGDNGTYLYNLTADFALEGNSSDEDEI